MSIFQDAIETALTGRRLTESEIARFTKIASAVATEGRRTLIERGIKMSNAELKALVALAVNHAIVTSKTA